MPPISEHGRPVAGRLVEEDDVAQLSERHPQQGMTHDPLTGTPAQLRGGVLEAIVAPEQLAVDRDRRHADDAQLVGGVGRLAQRLLDPRILRRGLDLARSRPACSAASSTRAGMLRSWPRAKASRNACSVNSRPLPAAKANVAARIAIR